MSYFKRKPEKMVVSTGEGRVILIGIVLFIILILIRK